MNADITIGNPEEATFYGLLGGQQVRVKKGDELLVVLNETEIPLTWATTEPDEVLDLKRQSDPLRANVKTTASGKSKILLLNEELVTVFHIDVQVFDANETVRVEQSMTNVKDN